MTNTTYLAESVEASRLRSMEVLQDFLFESAEAADRAAEVELSADYSPPLLVCHLGADKYVAIATGPSKWGGHFNKLFDLDWLRRLPSVREARVLCDFVLFVRCPRPADFVKQEVSRGFLPF